MVLERERTSTGGDPELEKLAIPASAGKERIENEGKKFHGSFFRKARQEVLLVLSEAAVFGLLLVFNIRPTPG